MGFFSFAESPQLQALLADIAAPEIRDASFSLYFTLAFGVGSLWVAAYGLIIAAFGEATGLPIVFGLMAVSFLLAALAVVPIRERFRATAAERPRGRGRGPRSSPDAGPGSPGCPIRRPLLSCPGSAVRAPRSGRGAAW